MRVEAERVEKVVFDLLDAHSAVLDLAAFRAMVSKANVIRGARVKNGTVLVGGDAAPPRDAKVLDLAKLELYYRGTCDGLTTTFQIFPMKKQLEDPSTMRLWQIYP